METYFQGLVHELGLYLPRAVGGLAVFFSFWVGGVVTQRLVGRIARHGERGRQDIMRLLGKVLKVTLILVGLVSALGTLGINVAAMVAGLGLTGFALSFALKDVLSNAVAGVLILFYQPFQRGDDIAVSGLEGRVVSVDLRYTTLQTTDGNTLVPNSVLFTQSITVKSSDT